MLKIVETNSAAQKRRYPDAKLLVAQDQQPCQIEELSRWAACVRSEPTSTIDEGANVVLEIDGIGQVPAEVVTMPDGSIGLMFHHDVRTQRAIAGWLRRKVHPQMAVRDRAAVHGLAEGLRAR